MITARRSLGLDPGPRVPGQAVVDTIRTALTNGSWSIPRLAEAVLADAVERARPLPAGSSAPTDWIGQKQQQWTHPGTVRR